MTSLISYLKNVQAEMKHVVWPTRKAALINTALIVVISAAMAVYIGLLDYGLTSLVGFIISR